MIVLGQIHWVPEIAPAAPFAQPFQNFPQSDSVWDGLTFPFFTYHSNINMFIRYTKISLYRDESFNTLAIVINLIVIDTIIIVEINIFLEKIIISVFFR